MSNQNVLSWGQKVCYTLCVLCHKCFFPDNGESPEHAAAIQSKIIKKKKKNKSFARDIEIHSLDPHNKSLSESSPTSDQTIPSQGTM